MPVRPALQGLMKHQVMLTTNGEFENAVITLWTIKAEYPIPGARLNYERGAIQTWLATQWNQLANHQITAVSMKSWDFGTTTPTPLGRYSFVPVIQGQNFSTRSAPLSLAAVVALRTEPVGSGIRTRLNGRLFHVGLTACSLDSLSTPNAATVQAGYNLLRDVLRPSANANSGQWCVVSWRANNAWRAVPLTIAVDHVLVRAQVGQQRRRMRNVGPYAVGS